MMQRLHQSTSHPFPSVREPPCSSIHRRGRVYSDHRCLGATAPFLVPCLQAAGPWQADPRPGALWRNRAQVGWGAGRALRQLRGSPCPRLPPSTPGMQSREKPAQPPQAACSEDQHRCPPQLLPRKGAAPGRTFTRALIPASAAGHEADPPAQRR